LHSTLRVESDLRVTWRAREAPDDSAFKNEQFLMYSGQDGKLLVFCVQTELRSLHATDYIIADGTFEMSPDSEYQVYTLHGSVHGKGLPLLWALLPNKSTATYVELFSSLRTALLQHFRSIGNMRYFLTDFERATISAIQQVFPKATTKGSNFHFRQAIIRRMHHAGLKAAYESEDTFLELRRWLRSLMATSMLPSFAIPLIWKELQLPPVTHSDMDVKARALPTTLKSHV